MMVHPVMVMTTVVRSMMVMESMVSMQRLLGNIANIGRRLVIDAEDALNPADHAADDAADHGANGSRAPIALIDTVGDAAGNALRLRRHGCEANHGENTKSKHCQFHMNSS
jgi:hypothetical protein